MGGWCCLLPQAFRAFRRYQARLHRRRFRSSVAVLRRFIRRVCTRRREQPRIAAVQVLATFLQEIKVRHEAAVVLLTLASLREAGHDHAAADP